MFWNSSRHIFNLLMNGYKGILRLTEEEINIEIDFIQKNYEKIKLMDSILEDKYYGQDYKFYNLITEGCVGMNNLSLTDLSKILSDNETDFKRKTIELSIFFDAHSNSIDGAEWYLEFLLNYGFKGYLHYTNGEIEHEHALFRNKLNEHQYRHNYEYYLKTTNSIYGTNLIY